MLQKVMRDYTAPNSQFKSNPNAAKQEANGKPVAVAAHNRVQFYAVPADLFEQMVEFCEYAQRGTSELKHGIARFSGSAEKSVEESATSMAKRLANISGSDLGDFKKEK
ncbi:hypothetical protein ACL7TT_03620 [Microbulbifer sp. 2304DJ12-6]|uniref:hypothetical protein n=1 Tax=Microbulbifer sp. 2304DJ12-6 TaxID=3233340 RepID=UPI0039AED9F1